MPLKSSKMTKVKKLLEKRYKGKVLEQLAEKLYPLIDTVGYDGLVKVSDLGHHVAAGYSWRTPIIFLEKSPDIIDRIGCEGLEKFANIIRQVVEHSERTAVSLIKKSPDIIDRIGCDGFVTIYTKKRDLHANSFYYFHF